MIICQLFSWEPPVLLRGFENKLEPEFSSKKLWNLIHTWFSNKNLFWLKISEVDLVHNCWICQCLISYVLSIVYTVQNHTFFILFFFTFWKQNHQVAKFVTKFKIIKKTEICVYVNLPHLWFYILIETLNEPLSKGHPKWQTLLQAILKLHVDYTPDMVWHTSDEAQDWWWPIFTTKATNY